MVDAICGGQQRRARFAGQGAACLGALFSRPNFYPKNHLETSFDFPTLYTQNGRSDQGHKVSLVAAVLLAGAMVPRYLKTHKVWPAGVMAVTGVVSALYEGKKTFEWM